MSAEGTRKASKPSPEQCVRASVCAWALKKGLLANVSQGGALSIVLSTV